MWRDLAPLCGKHPEDWQATMTTQHKQAGEKAERQDWAVQCLANHHSCIHHTCTPVGPQAGLDLQSGLLKVLTVLSTCTG